MHPNGHDRILPRRRVPDTHIFSYVLLDQLVFVCWNEREELGLGKNSQYLRIQLPGKAEPTVERISNEKEIEPNFERRIVFIAWKITGKFLSYSVQRPWFWIRAGGKVSPHPQQSDIRRRELVALKIQAILLFQRGAVPMVDKRGDDFLFNRRVNDRVAVQTNQVKNFDEIRVLVRTVAWIWRVQGDSQQVKTPSAH